MVNAARVLVLLYRFALRIALSYILTFVRAGAQYLLRIADTLQAYVDSTQINIVELVAARASAIEAEATAKADELLAKLLVKKQTLLTQLADLDSAIANDPVAIAASGIEAANRLTSKYNPSEN